MDQRRRRGYRPRPPIHHQYALRSGSGSINLVSEMPGSVHGDDAESSAAAATSAAANNDNTQLDDLAKAVMEIQHQLIILLDMQCHVGDVATQVMSLSGRVTAMESRPAAAAAAAPITTVAAPTIAVASPVTSFPYGMPGHGGIPPATTTTLILPHFALLPTATTTLPYPSIPLPITQIPFLHSPSPIPHDVRYGAPPPPPAGAPRYHKLSFPTFDGKEDPLG
ncbi:hypothetical protein U9M48_042222 [Paspalum notatum var. saurae]|uniref:Uncharacterized protein n=1 Tax=Paspalum notatum var. saurae TaxID=547442 RepID=A0AAQ3XE96_PASNO